MQTVGKSSISITSRQVFVLRGYGESDATSFIAVQMAIEDTKENKRSSKLLLTNTCNTVPWKNQTRDKLQKKGVKYHLGLPSNSFNWSLLLKQWPK